MFERFTDRARRVLVLAQEEARILGDDFLGGEHILLALVQEGDGVAAEALGQLGLDAGELRQWVRQAGGTKGVGEVRGAPPFTPGAKKALEGSLREALHLGHNYIGTEHLLLGLLRQPEASILAVLSEAGVQLEQVRLQVIELLTEHVPSPPEPTPRVAKGSGPVEIGLGLGMSLRVDDPDLAREVQLLVAVTDPVPLGIALRQTLEEHLRRHRQGGSPGPEPGPPED